MISFDSFKCLISASNTQQTQFNKGVMYISVCKTKQTQSNKGGKVSNQT